MDSLSPNNHKQSVTHDSSHALSRNLTEDLNMSSNVHNLKLSVKYDKSHSLSRIFTGQDLSMSSNNENSKLLSKNNETVEPSGSINGLQKNIYHNNDGTRIKTLPTMLENSFVKSSNRTKSTNNISNIPEKENCQSISDSGVNDNGNTKNNKHNEYTSISLDVEQIPIVFHNDLQESDCRRAKSSNDTIQCEIIKLLRQVVEQNFIILSDIKVLKEHHTLTMRNNLYKRPDGFPLKTVEEFKELETDTDRLQELLTYLKFVGGIKLREALSHFQKETMTDELTCKFTYWGRTKESLAFYNTQIAKVFFYTAKRCPNFKGPETRAEFKLEIMEVFRAAKQRQYLRNTKDKRTAETEEMCSEDAVSNDHFDTDGIFETEDPDARSDESD